MSSEAFQHGLAFVVRFDDHFTGTPVTDELPIRLRDSFQRPTSAPNGRLRHGDGTYRFVDVAPGVHEVMWTPPLTRHTDNWVDWEPPLSVAVPSSRAGSIVVRDLWPTPSATVSSGVTAIRGKLIGSNTSTTTGNRRVEIEALGASPRQRYTHTDSSGEFLFVVSQTAPLTAEGQLRLTISVVAATIAGGHVNGVPFVGADFEVVPSRATRVTFTIA